MLRNVSNVLETIDLILSGRRDSNPRPSAWKADALPTELLPQFMMSAIKPMHLFHLRTPRHQDFYPCDVLVNFFEELFDIQLDKFFLTILL